VYPFGALQGVLWLRLGVSFGARASWQCLRTDASGGHLKAKTAEGWLGWIRDFAVWRSERDWNARAGGKARGTNL